MKKILLLLAPILFSGCSYFNTSKKIDLIPYLQKDKYGYFDLKGKIVINPQFAFASAFREDLALVKTTGEKGKFGFIDKQGKFVINPTYKDATVFQEGIAWVVSDNAAPTAIDKKGEIKFVLKDAENVMLFYDGLAAFSKADSTSVKWGFINKSGEQVINPQFKDVSDFSEGKCAVRNEDGKWGYIDKTGKIIINYQFDDISRFLNGKAVVYLDEKAGVIDENGKYLVNPQFQNAFLDDDKILIAQDDKFGWCDKDGKFLINPQFDDANFFGANKLASIKTGDKFGYIDEEGKISINPQFEEAYQFMGDVAIVKTGNKYGLIDMKGKYTVNPQFEGIGKDVTAYLFGYSIAQTVETDYLNVESILKTINFDNPENLSFNDDFRAILRKKNKSIDDFSANDELHILFQNKVISNEASYDFYIMGKLKELNYNTYQYEVTSNKPTGFVYKINLIGRAKSKIEFIQNTFEKKLTSYSLMKKGYIDGLYTSVYKNSKNLVVVQNEDASTARFYFINKDFDISSYLNKIKENVNDIGNNEPEVDAEQYSESMDSITVDTSAVDTTY
jgi:hypothetical protein